jgi:hypothetical protein
MTPNFINLLFTILYFPDARERGQMKVVIASIFGVGPAHRPVFRVLAVNLLVNISDTALLTAASPLLDYFRFVYKRNTSTNLTSNGFCV